MNRLHERLNKDDLLRDVLLAGFTTILVGGLLFWAANHLENTRAARAEELENTRAAQAEVLENTRFVRGAVMTPGATLKPFQSMELSGAQLAALPLNCPQGAPVQDVAAGCANFVQANLSGADLTDANLRGAALGGADLTGAYLTGADLAAADLTGAILTGANLNWTDLRGADLTDAYLDGAVMDFTCYDSTTGWYLDYEPPNPPDCQRPRPKAE